MNTLSPLDQLPHLLVPAQNFNPLRLRLLRAARSEVSSLSALDQTPAGSKRTGSAEVRKEARDMQGKRVNSVGKIHGMKDCRQAVGLVGGG